MSMRRLYIVLRRAWARHANLVAGPAILGGPPVMAATLLGHAIERRLRVRVDDPAFGTASVAGMAMAVHERAIAGEVHYGAVQFQQRRGASFVVERKPRSKDYAGTQGYALSLQPTAEAHWCLSVVFEVIIDQCVPGDSVCRAAVQALHGARLAGGRLEIAAGGISVHEAVAGAFLRVGPGWYVVDLSADALGVEDASVGHGKSRVDALVDAILPVRSGDEAWNVRAAAVLGYGAIEAPVPADSREGVREGGDLHAFVEPLMGVIEYRPRAQVTDLHATFWRIAFDPEAEAAPATPRGLFYLTQDATPTTEHTTTGESP